VALDQPVLHRLRGGIVLRLGVTGRAEAGCLAGHDDDGLVDVGPEFRIERSRGRVRLVEHPEHARIERQAAVRPRLAEVPDTPVRHLQLAVPAADLVVGREYPGQVVSGAAHGEVALHPFHDRRDLGIRGFLAVRRRFDRLRSGVGEGFEVLGRPLNRLRGEVLAVAPGVLGARGNGLEPVLQILDQQGLDASGVLGEDPAGEPVAPIEPRTESLLDQHLGQLVPTLGRGRGLEPVAQVVGRDPGCFADLFAQCFGGGGLQRVLVVVR